MKKYNSLFDFEQIGNSNLKVKMTVFKLAVSPVKSEIPNKFNVKLFSLNCIIEYKHTKFKDYIEI